MHKFIASLVKAKGNSTFWTVHEMNQLQSDCTELADEVLLPTHEAALKVVPLMLSILFFLVATALAITGIFAPIAYIIVIIVWVSLLIPILIAAYFFPDKIMKYSDEIDGRLTILSKVAAFYAFLCVIITCTSTFVVVIWCRGRFPSRVDTAVHVIVTFSQIGFLLLTAGCHKFRFTRQFLIESGVFFFVTLLIALIIESYTLLAKKTIDDEIRIGRTLLIVFFAVEVAAALVYHTVRILKLSSPASLRNKNTHNSNVSNVSNNVNIA